MNYKIRKIRPILYWAFLIILFTNCGKEFDKFTPREATGLTENIFENFSIDPVVYNFSGSLSNELIFETEKGSVIYIERSALSINGADVDNSVPLSISILEITTKGEMIANNLSTTTDSRLLISERMFDVTVTSDNQEVSLKDGKTFKICVPNTLPDSEMQLFYGVNDGTDRIIWEEAEDTRALNINEWQFQTDGGVLADFGYVLYADRFDWINIDKYNDIPDDQKVEVRLDLPADIYNGQNSIAFMLFKELNAAVSLIYDSSTGQFYEPYGASPSGTAVEFVIITAMAEDEYQLGKKSATLYDGISYLVGPQPFSKEEITKILDEL